MAIFKKTAPAKTKAESTKEISTVAAKTDASGARVGRGLDLTMVLLRPHVTEKATDLSENRVYAFEINKLANKMHVRQAVEKFYKVQPVKVAVINIMPKYAKNPRTGRMQVKKQGLKKALVYLKAGDKIEFV